MRASSTWDIPLLPLVRTGSRAIGKKKTMKKKDGGKTLDEEKGSDVRTGELNRVIRAADRLMTGSVRCPSENSASHTEIPKEGGNSRVNRKSRPRGQSPGDPSPL
ncbi:uncharacterized protein LOC112455853 [Temnothorax curvispinosus]|uniref:Uncharacterized protein LOC112455853 n=1 Tax=Temnothorax curvispinosus TaxID=300111 RepID=A0A6J1PX90_9HYME|nr:uncharacterized protein LOC112455853 [Temnothorax curvispinosus]